VKAKKDSHVGFRMTPARHDALKLAALKRRVKLQQLLEEAVSAYLSENSEISGENPIAPPSTSEQNVPFPPEHAGWHEKLQRVLDSDVPDAIQAVTKNIEVFSEFVDIKEAQRAGGRPQAGRAASPSGNPAGAKKPFRTPATRAKLAKSL
jgi:hypothetical protein